MNRVKFLITVIFLLVTVLINQSICQHKDKGIRLGAGGGIWSGFTNMKDEIGTTAGGFVRHGIANSIDGKLDVKIGALKGPDNSSDLIVGEYKGLYRLADGDFEPYVGFGLGLLTFNINKPYYWPGKSSFHTNFYIPTLIGAEISIVEDLQVDINANFNYSFAENLVAERKLQNGIWVGRKGSKDAWWGVFAGLSYTIFGGDVDADNDGLLESDEEKLGTDPEKADSDDDGLNDGDEINKYRTNPLKADSDGDGISDKDEVTNRTNPNKIDTDGDGLTDGDEVSKYQTDPLKIDTDGDGLSDGDEINNYKSNPLKIDSDGDGLSDGDEVINYKSNPSKSDTDNDGLNDSDEIQIYKSNPTNVDTDKDGLGDGEELQKYGTDPLKVDTDGDGLNDRDEIQKFMTDPLKVDTDGDGFADGLEVMNKTNPLDPKDPKKEIPKPKIEAEALSVEAGQAIVLEGIVFEAGSAKISPKSEEILARALATFLANPTIEVEIRGYTDNLGDEKKNLKLSQNRAEAVKKWLVKRGIPASRITAKGYGSANPIAPNETVEGRAKNRRIEFYRIK